MISKIRSQSDQIIELSNYYICFNKLLHVCNKFIILRRLSGTPQKIQGPLQHQSTANQPLPNVTKNSIPNVNEVIENVIGTRSNRVWFLKICWQSNSQKTTQVQTASPQNTISYLKLLLLTYRNYFASFSNPVTFVYL